jgi:hypothetical protein
MSYTPEDFLCDTCYVLWSTRDDDPLGCVHEVLIDDFCERCKAKLAAWFLGDDLPSELIRFRT